MRPLQIAQGNASNYAHAVDSSSSACHNLDDKDLPISFFAASKSAFLLIISRTDLWATSCRHPSVAGFSSFNMTLSQLPIAFKAGSSGSRNVKERTAKCMHISFVLKL